MTLYAIKLDSTNPLTANYSWISKTISAGAIPKKRAGTGWNGSWSKFQLINDMGNGQSALVMATSTFGPTYVRRLPNTGIDPVSGIQSDWNSRSKAAGVFYATNFSEFTTRDALINGAYQTAYANDQYGPSGRYKVELESSIALSGKSIRSNLFAAEGANEAGGSWNFSFDGVGAKTQNLQKSEFYFQFALYGDSTWANWQYANGAKIAIIAMPNQSYGNAASAGVNEIVLFRDKIGPYPGLYRWSTAAITGTSLCSLAWSSDTQFLSNYTHHIFYNSNPTNTTRPANSTELATRFGKTQYGWTPPANYFPRVESNGWTVYEVYVNRTYNGTGMIKVWSAPYGQQPILWGGSTDARLGTSGYTGIHLLPRTENAWEGAWPTVDTFACYGEVICSDNPIAFPGGYTIPYIGTALPANFPWNGATQVVEG
jgi:hypothetical protein